MHVQDDVNPRIRCMFEDIFLLDMASFILHIMKTGLDNFDRLNPTFIKYSWGLQGYTFVFLFC